MADLHLLKKRDGGLYWRPNSEGYTAFKAEAGRYSLEEAQARVSHTTEMLPEAEGPDVVEALVGALLFVGMRAGIAYGKDWDLQERDVDESARDVEERLFCEHFPGFEGGTDRLRYSEAISLVELARRAPHGRAA